MRELVPEFCTAVGYVQLKPGGAAGARRVLSCVLDLGRERLALVLGKTGHGDGGDAAWLPWAPTSTLQSIPRVTSAATSCCHHSSCGTRS